MQIKFHLTHTAPYPLPKHLQYLYQGVKVIENLYIDVITEMSKFLEDDIRNFSADLEIIADKLRIVKEDFELFQHVAINPLNYVMEQTHLNPDRFYNTYEIAFCVLDCGPFFQKLLPIISKVMRRPQFTKIITIDIVSEPETFEIRNRPPDFQMTLNSYIRGLISVYERRIPKNMFHAKNTTMSEFE